MFCQKCGGKLESYASNCAFCGAPVEKYDDKMKYVKVEKEEKAYKPMTAWKWIGLSLLPAVPFVGAIIYLILMFKWAFGGTPDLSLKGYARANLLVMLFVIILFAGLVALFMVKPELYAHILQLLEAQK